MTTSVEMATRLDGMNNRTAWRTLNEAADQDRLTGEERQIWMEEVWLLMKEKRRQDRAKRHSSGNDL